VQENQQVDQDDEEKHNSPRPYHDY